ncbi:TPA: hypothetical protein ACID7X_002174 [Pseudomonas aeruginosa]
MAGVKGKSGGPRKNAGGARPGAGRKPKNSAIESAKESSGSVRDELEPQAHGGTLKRSRSEPVLASKMDMLEYLQGVALGLIESTPLQVRAAIAAVQYTHAKKGEGGKKDEQAEAAKAAGRKFGSTPPPLRAVK